MSIPEWHIRWHEYCQDDQDNKAMRTRELDGCWAPSLTFGDTEMLFLSETVCTLLGSCILIIRGMEVFIESVEPTY